MMVTIYALCHPEMGEVRYVGLTRNLQHRMACHKNKPSTKHLQNWISSLPRFPAVRILEEVPESECDTRERAWIALFRSQGIRLLNYTDGGEGRFSPSKEVKDKMSEAAKRRGFKISAELRAKMVAGIRRAARVGRMYRPDGSLFRQLNESRRGIPLSEDHRAKVSAALLGKQLHRTEETRRKVSDSKKVHWQNPEYRARILSACMASRFKPGNKEIGRRGGLASAKVIQHGADGRFLTKDAGTRSTVRESPR